MSSGRCSRLVKFHRQHSITVTQTSTGPALLLINQLVQVLEHLGYLGVDGVDGVDDIDNIDNVHGADGVDASMAGCS